MLEAMVVFIVIWIAVSIPIALLLGRFLATSNQMQDEYIEDEQYYEVKPAPLPYSD